MRRLALAVVMLVALATPMLAQDAVPTVSEGIAAYERGDYAMALREFRPLAEQGYAGAQNNLGLMYARGRGVPQDYAAAVKWYRKAAEQGYVEAQHNLGFNYGTPLPSATWGPYAIGSEGRKIMARSCLLRLPDAYLIRAKNSLLCC